MSNAYFIQLNKPIKEEGVSYFGRPRDVINKIERTSIACYTSRKGAENTIVRLRKFKDKYGTYPSFELLNHIDINDEDNRKLIKDRIHLKQLDFETMEYACTLTGLSLLMCNDVEGLVYYEHTFIEMGCDTYREVLQDIIFYDNH
tara:strand:+ start:7871 stop:8305 length:435 start_codon:yes stop_codon:yes gene_type:complete